VITDLSVAFNFTESAKLLSANNILIFIQILIGPTTAVRPRLVNGAIDYTAAPTTVDLRTQTNLLILETSLNLDKTEDLFC
jgi:iron complex outermembrane receptor protein